MSKHELRTPRLLHLLRLPGLLKSVESLDEDGQQESSMARVLASFVLSQAQSNDKDETGRKPE